MKLRILKDYDALSQTAADEILLLLQRKPDAVLCLATGETPRGAYRHLVQGIRDTHTNVSRCTFIALDEWVGIPPDQEGSCSRYLNEHLFQPLGIASHQVNLFDGMVADLPSECARMNRIVVEKGGIDLMLVGVGMNGHIGFNEPGVSPDLDAHVADLDAITQNVGQKYFTKTTALRQGITLGLKHFRESRMAMMIVSGKQKAEVMRLAFEEAVSTQVPASLIRKHEHATVLLDQDAASLLKSGMRLTGLKGQGGIL